MAAAWEQTGMVACPSYMWHTLMPAQNYAGMAGTSASLGGTPDYHPSILYVLVCLVAFKYFVFLYILSFCMPCVPFGVYGENYATWQSSFAWHLFRHPLSSCVWEYTEALVSQSRAISMSPPSETTSRCLPSLPSLPSCQT